ncbi:MAG TPA: pseudouridine-5'-phosphate glycosidase [Elusimicrobiales bacterium]|nr:pseudouridine-5'-phosphate glycosidase [Elusimicrobiales bacterium]
MNLEKYLTLGDEVRQAKDKGRPLVALESTIISHGMPYPENVKTALEVESVVRSRGAVPATVAILDGKIVAGLSGAQIEELGRKGQGVVKASRRDLPVILAKRIAGATTVAGTMIAARLAGIEVFATGGIGGAHRGAQRSFDISADLTELARTDVAVVCAGVKAILDIGLTLEILETLGVPVISYGTDNFPAFYTRSSGFKTECRCDTPAEIARALRCKWDLGLAGGAVIANPVPAAAEANPALKEEAIALALAEADKLGIAGKRVTPYLLEKIALVTGGKSLATNIALIKSNAALAADIACSLRS